MASASPLRILATLGCVLPALAVAEEPYETLPVREAARLVSQPLEAPEYRIEPTVRCESDFLYRFEIVTPSGSFAARGLDELPMRLREAHALAILAERSAGEVVAESAGETVDGAVGSVVKVVEEPEETGKGAARGIGRWAKRTALAARELATGAKQRVDEARDGGEAEQGEENAPVEAPADPDQEAGDEPNAAGETAKAVGRFVLGHSGARRRYAAKLGVDPYSRNPVLAAELDRVAWSASSARFATNLMLPTIPLVPEVQSAYSLVWAHHPRDLEVRNRGLADAWGVDRQARDRFFWNEEWTPTEQTAYVAAIESLGPTPGKRTLLEDAADLTDPGEISRRVAGMELLAGLHDAGTHFVRVEAAGRTLWGVTAEEVIVPLAADHVVWTLGLEAALREGAATIRRLGPGDRPLVLAVSGAVSGRVRDAALVEGWQVRSVARPVDGVASVAGRPPA